MADRTPTATRISFLELSDERRMVREGHALLDEKRMLLAAEILAGLRRYRELRAGWLDGDALGPAEIAALATLPGLDELRDTLVGLLQAPAGKFVRTIAEPQAKFVRLLAAYRDQQQAA